jgi:hypothetical protein
VPRTHALQSLPRRRGDHRTREASGLRRVDRRDQLLNEFAWRQRHKLIRAQVRRAAEDARVAVQIGALQHIIIVPSVDAGGVGWQAEIASRDIYEQRVGGDVAHAFDGQRRCATVIQAAGAII